MSTFSIYILYLFILILENDWPEEIICDILSLGASGPHAVNILDKANEKSSLNVLTSSNHNSFPERVLVWSLSAAMKHLKSDKGEKESEITIGQLDFLLCRDFSHNHLVGALRSLETAEAAALLEFLTEKIKGCPLKSTKKKAGVEQLSKWMGAVIDAHPTTYTLDENESMLRAALASVEEKVKNRVFKLFIKSFEGGLQ